MRIPLSFLLLLPACLLPVFSLTACGSPKPGLSGHPVASRGLTFTGRRPDGREIALSDRTKWSVQPAGASATLRWQPGEPVSRVNTGNPLWPAAITSHGTGGTALARPAGRF